MNSAVAIYVIDPGQTTGCGTILANMGLPTVRQIIGRAKAKGLIETWNVKGPYTKQAHEISKDIVDFFFHVHVEKGWVDAGSMYIVIEDFHLRMLSADLSPIWVTAGIECLLADKESKTLQLHGHYDKQMPSEAKGFVSDDMLKRWGLWRRHTPHQRDVIRHMARKLDILLQEQS
jgi:hypothetical protein